METKLKSPQPRAQSLFCSIGKNKFVLIAGANRTEHFGDAWLLQAEISNSCKWVKLNTNTIPRSGHSGGGDSNSIYFFGGQDVHSGQLYNDVGIFDCGKLTMSPINYIEVNVGKMIPIPRNSHTFCYDNIKKNLILFGGAGSTGELNDLFIFDPNTKIWENRTQTSGSEWPSAREMQISHIYHKPDGSSHMLVIGGRIIGDISSEIWTYEIEKNIWTRKKVCPIKIAAAGSTIYKDQFIFIFGGTDGQGFLNDLWIYDIIKDEWKKFDPSKLSKILKDASGKIAVSMEVTDEYLIMFGGCGIEQEFGNVDIIPLETLIKEFGISITK